MNRPNTVSMIRAAAVFGALAVCAAAVGALAGEPVDGVAAVSGPEAMREELLYWQFVAPPSEKTLACDAGTFLLLPDGSDLDAEWFAAGLLSAVDASGAVRLPVTVFEDAETRETVFLNAAGNEILRQPPPLDYRPDWILERLYPAGDAPADVASAYDPARVVMGLRLLFPRMATGAAEAMDPSPGRAGGRAASSAGTGVSERTVHTYGSPLAKGAGEDAWRSGFKIWHVDSDMGSDANDGLSPDVRGRKRGPKASVQQAIEAAGSGDVIEVRGRAPLPDSVLRPKGKQIRLRPKGTVRF